MKKSRGKTNWKRQIFLATTFVTAVVFAPTTVLLTVGMLPTVVASVVDRSKEKMLGLTVGALNLAGCAPFVFQLWTGSHDITNTVDILTNPMSVIVMYFAAAAGYVIEWSLTGMVVVFMTEKARLRLGEIEKLQEEMVRKWGVEVTGRLKLGADGFPLDTEENENVEMDEKSPSSSSSLAPGNR